MVEYYPISAKDQSRIHQFGKKVLPGLFLGYALNAGGNLEGDIMVADIEELEKMDVSEIYAKRLNSQEVIFPKENGKFIFPVADGRIKFVGGGSGTENIHLDTGSSNSRRRSKRFSWRIRRVSTSTTSRLTSGCLWSDKWLLVHFRKLHIRPSRWTQSQTLLAERRIIPYSTEIHWRLQNYAYKLGCCARKPHRWLLEYRWIKRFVWFLCTLSSEKPPGGHMWSWERLTKRQATSRPDHLWPELWRGMSKNAQLREKYKWTIENPKLDNARRLRGIYLILLSWGHWVQGNHQKIVGRKLETPMALAMPCKICKKSKHGGDPKQDLWFQV